MKIIKSIKSLVPDVLMISGAVSIGYGAFLIYKAAGFICWGVLLIAGAILSVKGG